MRTSSDTPATPRPAIIPVLDIMGGRVVRAVGGRRSEYRPITSVLTDSTEPGAVATALVAATGATWLYVADLDAITHRRPDAAGVRAVAAAGRPILLDGGIRTADEFAVYAGTNASAVVGTETGGRATVRAFGHRCVLSLDLYDGNVLGDAGAWGGTLDPLRIAEEAVSLGVEVVIVIDLARVGTGTGAGTDALVAECRRRFPEVDIIAGGGVRTRADVRRLGDAGADGVLVASALHDGTLSR